LVPKYTKRKIKCGWTGCCLLKRRLVRLSDQVSVAFWACSLEVLLPLSQANSSQKQHCCSLTLRSRFAEANCVQNWTGHVRSLRRRLSEHSSVQNKNFEFQNPFSQTLQFWSSHTQNSSQIMFIGHVHKHIHKNAQNSWIKHHFCSNSKIHQNFHNYSTSTTTFITNSLMSKIIIPIHQQHVFKHHQHNYSWIHSKFNKIQLQYNFIIHHFFTKTQHIHIYDFWHMNSISTTIIHSIHMYKHIINIKTWIHWLNFT